MRAVKDSAAYCRKGQCGDEGDVNAEGAPDDVLRVGKLTATPYRKGEDVSAENEEEDDGFATGDEGTEDPGWRMELADGPPVVADDGYGGDSADCVELCDSSCRGVRGCSRLWGRRHAFNDTIRGLVRRHAVDGAVGRQQGTYDCAANATDHCANCGPNSFATQKATGLPCSCDDSRSCACAHSGTDQGIA